MNFGFRNKERNSKQFLIYGKQHIHMNECQVHVNQNKEFNITLLDMHYLEIEMAIGPYMPFTVTEIARPFTILCMALSHYIRPHDHYMAIKPSQ